MRFTVIASQRAPHQLAHQIAMAKGLAAHGIEPVLSHHQAANTEYVACWGWRNGKALRDAGHEVLVMERGYIGDRFAWTSLAWNGLNGRAQFPDYPADSERFERHFSMRPWKEGGDYVLLMGQVPGDASLQGRNMTPWYEKSSTKAAEAYGLPVLFRQHPVAARKGYRQTPKHAEASNGELDEALARAAVVITFNSNSGVDAVLAGVPTIAVDQGSMAWGVAGHQIGEIRMPDRRAWANALAWKQWALPEIESGAALCGLLQGEMA